MRFRFFLISDLESLMTSLPVANRSRLSRDDGIYRNQKFRSYGAVKIRGGNLLL
jgi:hypothetical protein